MLQSLNMTLLEHELNVLRSKGQMPFPTLTTLHLDASNLHGSHGGTVVDKFLKAAPALQSLTLRWDDCGDPECVPDCAIYLDWKYDFPSLKYLKLWGEDLGHGDLVGFLKRHGGVMHAQINAPDYENYYSNPTSGLDRPDEGDLDALFS